MESLVGEDYHAKLNWSKEYRSVEEKVRRGKMRKCEAVKG
jgi:hypothetical protein